MSDWHAYIEDDEDDNVCIYIQLANNTGTRELFGQVDAADAEIEELNNENELLAKAESEAERRNKR